MTPEEKRTLRIGFALTGSYCTFHRVFPVMERLAAEYGEVWPIFSERSAVTDTRFGNASTFLARAEEITGHRPILTIREAEPIGPKRLFSALVIAPCTGNTLAKLASGMTDGSVPMAAKAHLRGDGPLVIAPSTNDGLSASLGNIGALLQRKQIYFVPFGQDDPIGKPNSLVAEMERIPETLEAALAGRQLQPLLLGAER
ncbi:MAG: dipicolinate synthase subunit B [Oscillospiraceae bacterium]|nr:dipicolinate synthase subunit B [Oscillospiraceae bacterium]